MTLSGSALTQFDRHIHIDQDIWTNVDSLFTSRYNSFTKQEDVSDELASLMVTDFRKEGKNDKDVLTELIDRVATLTPLALRSDCRYNMQKTFLWSAASSSKCGIHAERSGSTPVIFHQYVDTLFVSIITLERHQEDATKVDSHSGIFYVGQKKYGCHPSQVSNVRPDNISVFSKPKVTEATAPKPYNRCFNCWAPDAPSVRARGPDIMPR